MKSVVIHAEGNVCVEERPIPTRCKRKTMSGQSGQFRVMRLRYPAHFRQRAHYYPYYAGARIQRLCGILRRGGNRPRSPAIPITPSPCVTDPARRCALLLCFQCPQCQREYFSLCKQYQFVGSRSEGGNAEYGGGKARQPVPPAGPDAN